MIAAPVGPVRTTLARSAYTRLGRFLFALLAVALTAPLAFAFLRLNGTHSRPASVFAALVAAIVFCWFQVFLNLRTFGYYPRPVERLVDRAVGLAIVVPFGVLVWLSTPGFIPSAVLAVGVVAIALHVGRNGLASAEYVRDRPAYPRSTADARRMLKLLKTEQRRRLKPREVFFIRLNTALALTHLAESEDTYRRLHDAYDILSGLAATAASDGPVVRRVVAEALVEVTFRLYWFGDAIELYEQATDLLDRELRGGGEPYAEYRRLLSLADLRMSRAGVAPGPLPTDLNSWKMSLREAVGHLLAALPLAPRNRLVDLHFRLAFCHSQLADLLADPAHRDEAITHARTAARKVTWLSRENRPYAELILAKLLLDQFGESQHRSGLIAEAERLANRIRSSREPDVRAQALQVRLSALNLRDEAGMSSPEGLDLPAVATEIARLQPYSRARLRTSAMLANWAANRGEAGSAAWAYQDTIATARNISATGLVRRQQQASLYEVGGFAAEAAYWLLERGQPVRAVEAIEASRALVLSSAVHRDMLVRRLESFDPELARRCARLGAQLARVDPPTPATPDAGLLWAVAQDRRAARTAHQEWQQLSGWLSRWPEYSALLQPSNYEHIVAAARWQPLVYLFAAQRCGYAMVVRSGPPSPDVLRLDGLTSERVAEVVRNFSTAAGRLADPMQGRTHWRSALTGCLDWLGEHVMRPLTGYLRTSGPVALIPVGDLALLPLHAAADLNGTGGVTFTYAASAPVMAHAAEKVRMRDPAAAPRSLVVTSAGSPGQQLRYLGYAAEALGRYAGGVTELPGRFATRKAVLAALGAHDVYHFACHGAADGSDPLESHLQVDDGRLTVRDLLDQRVRGRLAVLAACETGVPYAQLPDESIGLPAALLEAGVPGVVATLWPVEEIPMMLLTTRFYEQWLRFGQQPALALHQAQHWLRTSTYGQLEAYVRKHLDGSVKWPYRHTGAARQHTMFSHPDHWAAVTYTGI